MVVFIIMELSKNEFQKLKNRDPKIFEKLYIEYKDKIFSYLIIKTSGNRELAEDLLCETFHSAFVTINKLKNAKNIIGWFIKIAFYKWNDYLRQEYKEKKIVENSYHSNINHAKDHVKNMEQKEQAVVLHTALDNIDSEYKDILIMMYFKKKSRKEICEKLNKNLYTVQNILYKARQVLKIELKKAEKVLL